MIERDDRRSEEGVALDRMFEALSHPMRRRLLAAMREQAKRDGFEAVAFVPRGETRDRVRTELHHKHLPHLDEAGFIEWDREADAIRKGPRFEEIESLLALMETHGDELPGDWP